ncbi:hypothetical protein CLAFUW4_09691 [Fulvia fulva]|uniref:Uncharacterized protein n=1 Tax=Passalora fulva TaxID=5499 RepID=A0A9Q8PGE8_PASFU|nr:uncharacterized protein CLAFUR5_09785 [Fulvia fulva]KAK4613831.1 hypothetical protein CLAFUR4_09696 [Fulvia fulva]KAK4615079.1 hypothetical protein CLAFUR0_09687 [Fulvia fulva]UJO22139.1 hypothetical protein CLAFUR5_09785 [Fulvia fulva]WPV19921.1 hypothetical protein CLAFUW4_09691 [Fulvia fulva]WPV35397.1 hypothetical protein CLAFUW7_09692 [Fulvia fulva]
MSHTLRAAFYPKLRHNFDQTAKDNKGDPNKAISASRSLAEIWIEGAWHHNTLESSEVLQASLEAFWYGIATAAKDSSELHQQQSLLRLVQEKLDIGTLERENDNQVEAAQTPDGQVWSDLPFFRATFFDAFLKAPPVVEPWQCTNLHTIAAHITVATSKDLRFYAIWAMVDALESHELYLHESDVELHAALEPIKPVLAWLQHASLHLRRACLENLHPPDQRHDGYLYEWHHEGPEFVGPLAQKGGITQAGFSVERWMFWRDQLTALETRTREAADSAVQVAHQDVLQSREHMQAWEQHQ